eukprot:GHVT01047937.1.p1 GENE.GHVT01047937.1~~GHVT01047937.1.p1  ORF type:complete len:100 (-),score=10.24 GHVT01047937.1:221-520(-)
MSKISKCLVRAEKRTVTLDREAAKRIVTFHVQQDVDDLQHVETASDNNRTESFETNKTPISRPSAECDSPLASTQRSRQTRSSAAEENHSSKKRRTDRQ